jgi:glycosyltransferase involved in cell wall biosynthesis
VGLYPIDTAHPLAHGKCGLKAVLYMAQGVPPVVTPTASNADIVRDGVDGLFADTPADWTAAVGKLLDDPELWERLSVASHARALADFSVTHWAPWVAAELRRLGSRRD